MPDASPRHGIPSPLVSVVLCTHEGRRFLEPQLESLLGQSHANLQIIVVDDGSRDGTRERLADYAAFDRRIELIAHDRCAGMATRFEEGLARVRGDYVAPADQDDVWAPAKVAALLDLLGSHAAVYSASLLIDAAGRPLGSTLLAALGGLAPVSGRDPWRLFWHNTVSGHATLFRASLIPELVPFDRALMYDHQIGILATVRGGLAYTDKPLVQHRVHERNQTTRLPDARPTPRDPNRRTERRLASRRRERSVLAKHGAFFARRRIDPAFTERTLAGLLRAREEFPLRRFDYLLFAMLLRERRRLLCGEPAPLRRAWSTAKAERWYRRAQRGARRAPSRLAPLRWMGR